MIVYNAIRTPDGTVLESLHRHDCKFYTDTNGKTYMIDGGLDYVHRSDNGDEEVLTVYSNEPFEKVRKYAYRTGYGKPGSPDYGTFRKTTLVDMEDDHLEASLVYKGITPGSEHWKLLLQEKLYRNEHN